MYKGISPALPIAIKLVMRSVSRCEGIKSSGWTSISTLSPELLAISLYILSRTLKLLLLTSTLVGTSLQRYAASRTLLP